MQLARTLFIPTQNVYKRKILEILLSPWINTIFPKKEILKLYISSVQYEKHTYGIINAMKHFQFFRKGIKLTPEQSFFLVERLSNVTSSFKKVRIQMLLKQISKDKPNEEKVFEMYNDFDKKGLLKKKC